MVLRWGEAQDGLGRWYFLRKQQVNRKPDWHWCLFESLAIGQVAVRRWLLACRIGAHHGWSKMRPSKSTERRLG